MGEHVHLEGYTATGDAVVTRCNEETRTSSSGVVTRHPDGVPFQAGREYLYTEPTGDPNVRKIVHTVDMRGPATVTTAAYRDGWDRIFTKESAS